MCLWGKIGNNPKYKSTKKNEGRIPPLNDYRVAKVPFACGECMECRKQKARDWKVRLHEDIKVNKNGRMVVLTFSNESYAELDGEINVIPYKPKEGYDRDNAIATLAMKRFGERWRKKYKKWPRHWMVTELGHKGTENIHLHGIIWAGKEKEKIESIEEIRKIWKYGFIYPRNKREAMENYVNDKTVAYNIKYVHKIDKDHKKYKQIVLSSNGIGKNYINTINSKRNKYNGEETIETYKMKNGHEIALPKYYRNLLYTEEEKEKLWIDKLNKEERWVDGVRIDISKGEKNYYIAVEDARRKNYQLGYGNGSKNRVQEEYEKERREIIQMTRIIKGKKQT